jgi:hypothetical protein
MVFFSPFWLRTSFWVAGLKLIACGWIASVFFACNEKNPHTGKSFKNTNLSIKKNQVFYDEQLIPEADAFTFESMEQYYSRDSKRIFFHRFVRNPQDYYLSKTYIIRHISEADYATFKVVKDAYAKDLHHVYYNGSILHTADVQSFSWAFDHFYTDEKHVYKFGMIFPEADPASFHELDYGYTADNQYVWQYDRILKIPFQDTLVARGRYFVLDSIHVFFIDDNAYPNVRVLNTRPANFEVVDVNFMYAKDAENVYYKDSIVIGADPNTFKCAYFDTLIGEIFPDARDVKRFYFEGKSLPVNE